MSCHQGPCGPYRCRLRREACQIAALRAAVKPAGPGGCAIVRVKDMVAVVREIQRKYDLAAGRTAAPDAVKTMTGKAGIEQALPRFTAASRDRTTGY